MRHLKTFKLFESIDNIDDILQALVDSSSIPDIDNETTYNVSGYNILHYGFEDVRLDEPEINKELKRIEAKIYEHGYFLMSDYDKDNNRLFVAFVPNELNRNFIGISKLNSTDDDVKSYYRFDNGNSIFVWDLDKDTNFHMNSDERFEVEDDLSYDLWRTNSKLLITFCMWNNQLHKLNDKNRFTKH
jgi:hypothetical protein